MSIEESKEIKRARNPSKRNRNEHDYSVEEIVNAISLYKLYNNFKKVADETNIPYETVRRWINDPPKKIKELIPVEISVEERRERAFSNIRFVMDEALQQIHKEIDKASAAQAATIFGILFDKYQIMFNNSSPQINNNLYLNIDSISDEEKLTILQRTLERKKQAESPQPIDITQLDD